MLSSSVLACKTRALFLFRAISVMFIDTGERKHKQEPQGKEYLKLKSDVIAIMPVLCKAAFLGPEGHIYAQCNSYIISHIHSWVCSCCFRIWMAHCRRCSGGLCHACALKVPGILHLYSTYLFNCGLMIALYEAPIWGSHLSGRSVQSTNTSISLINRRVSFSEIRHQLWK